MTIESVAANTARNGAGGAAQPGPRPGDRKPARSGGATTNTPVPTRQHPRRAQPGQPGQTARPGLPAHATPGDPRPRPGQPQGQGKDQEQIQRQNQPQRPRPETRGERSLYDGGSPSANRLGPAKAMRARDVSRPGG